MNSIRVPFSDTVAGYVTDFDGTTFGVRSSGGDEYRVKLKDNTYAYLIRNLGEPYADATGQMRDMLTPGRYLFTYGIFYPEGGELTFEAQYLIFVGRRPNEYLFEQPDWWVRQITALGNFYLKAQFQGKPIDYRDYRTTITLTGDKPTDNYRQET